MKINSRFVLLLIKITCLSSLSYGDIKNEAAFKLNTFFNIPDGWLAPSETKLKKQSTSILLDFVGDKLKYPQPESIVVTLPNFIGENKDVKTGRLKIERYLEECSESRAKIESKFLEKTKFGYIHNNICKSNNRDLYQVISISDLSYSRLVSFIWSVDEIEIKNKLLSRYKIAYGIRTVLPAIFCADKPAQCSDSQLGKQYGKYIETFDAELSLRMLSTGFMFNQDDWWPNYYDQILNFLEFLPSQAFSENTRCLQINNVESPDGYFVYCDISERVSKKFKSSGSNALVFDSGYLRSVSISSEQAKRIGCQKLELKESKLNPKYTVFTCQDDRLLVKETRQTRNLDKLSVDYMINKINSVKESEVEFQANLNSLISSISLKIHFCSRQSEFMNNCDDIHFYTQEGTL